MFTEDLSDFINPETPGYAVATGVDEHGVVVNIGVLIDMPGLSAPLGMEGMASTQPAVQMASADVRTAPVGWALAIDGVDYVVAEHQPDGTGVSRLVLEAAA